MHAVALAAREQAHFLLLICALEVEPATIGAAWDFFLAAEQHLIKTAGDFLPDCFLVIKVRATLIDVGNFDRVTQADRTAVWLFRSRQHLEQRRLTRAVRTDDADNAAGGKLERQAVDQEAVAECFRQVLGLDDNAAKARAGCDLKSCFRNFFAAGLFDQLVVSRNAGLGFRLPGFWRRADPLEFARQRLLLALFLRFLDRFAFGALFEPA